MIPLVQGWLAGRDGDALIQVPPSGDLEGIRYLERRRPTMAAEALVRDLPMPAGATVIAISAPRRLVTDEGEYAELVTTEVDYRGAAIHRAIGIVHVDDFDAVTIGHVRRPHAHGACDALVEALIRRDRHDMPTRRRPYQYAPPPGWRAARTERLTTTWCAPGDGRRITVLPALPLRPEDPAEALEALLDLSGPRTILETFVARGGLVGETWTGRRADGPVDLALLVDDRYTYAAWRARPDDGPADDMFATLLATIEPIPRDRARPCDAATFAHWTV